MLPCGGTHYASETPHLDCQSPLPRCSVTSRESRLNELEAMRAADPMRLIALFCEITGQPVTNQLPLQTSFASMITTILDHEEQRQVAVNSDVQSA